MPRPSLNIHQKIYIRANRLEKSSRDLANDIGFSRDAVGRYIRNAKIKPPKSVIEKFRIRAMSGKTIMTPEQDKILISEYLNLPVKTLAKQIGVSGMVLSTRIMQLGLKIPEALIQQRKENSRFKKGMVSHNKGKKQAEFLTPDQIKRTKATRFKKGHAPHNQKEKNGCISIRTDSQTGTRYKWIRLSVGEWQELHRYRYEQKHGPIPAGHIVTFEDGNSLNCEPENLRCISRAENGIRNMQQYHSYPPELKKAIILKNKLIHKLESR